MARLFGRNYLVRITDLDESSGLNSIEIRPPFHISFNCQRKTKLASNLNLTIYGLGEKKRSILAKRNYESANGLIIENGQLVSNPIAGVKKRSTDRGYKELQIELYIGYGEDSNLKRIFKGELRQAVNTLSDQGYATEIEAFSTLSIRSRSFTSRTIRNRLDAIRQLMNDAGLEIGNIELANSEYIRPKILSGRPIDILKAMANDTTEQFFIDNEKAYFIKKNSTISDRIIKVSADRGLLNTPTRQFELVNFRSMINPDFEIGSKIELESFVDKTVNGTYSILDLVYVGDYEGPSWLVEVQAQAIGETLG